MTNRKRLGIVGGTGALGSAIARGLLQARALSQGELMVSGRRAQGGLPGYPLVTYTNDNRELGASCDTVMLSVPPARAGEIGAGAQDKLVISVMAGVPVETLSRLTGSARVIRAMSSPAAAARMAYSPYFASEGATAADRAEAHRLFAACGMTDELSEEAHLDIFTAMTGPVPGFVALFADCMVEYARARGIEEAIALRAVRQLFGAGAAMIAEEPATPAAQVQAMIDYAGTTAAGLREMRRAGIQDAVSRGLDAAAKRARELGSRAGET